MAPEGRIARLGALVVAPRRLARRDLDAQDGKAGDDLLLLSILALVLDGALSVVRAASSLAAGRSNTALRRLSEVVKPGTMIVGAWAVASIVFLLFTLREPRRAAVELGARVTASLVLASLLLAPVLGVIQPGPLRYVLQALPYAVATVMFGLLLREALEREPGAPPPRTFGVGATLVVLLAASGLFLFDRALAVVAGERRPERAGARAPSVDLPLLDGPARLQLVALRGRPVVLSFWATWCGPCLEELPVIERLQKQRRDDAPPIFAINVDEPGPDRERAVRGVVRRLGLTMPIALDDGGTAAAYSIETIPTLVRVGADGAIEHLWDRPLDEDALRDALNR